MPHKITNHRRRRWPRPLRIVLAVAAGWLLAGAALYTLVTYVSGKAALTSLLGLASGLSGTALAWLIARRRGQRMSPVWIVATSPGMGMLICAIFLPNSIGGSALVDRLNFGVLHGLVFGALFALVVNAFQ